MTANTGNRALRPAELIRAAAIARRYYLDGASKIEIAEEFGISRFKVARVLDEARAAGLVRIDIAVPAEIDAELSEGLRAVYGLRQAVVATKAEDSDDSLRRRIGKLGADYLTEVLREGDVLGLACSRTLNAMTLALGPLPRCTVVQLTGVLPGGVEENSVELVRRVASLARGPVYPIYAPLVVSDPVAAADLRRQPQVAEAMRHYPELTKAVITVGSWEPPISTVRDALPQAEAEALSERGVRAEFCARLLDGEGHPMSELADRVIAITPEQLRDVPEVIAVAGGIEKADAIRAVLRGGFVSALVTDAGVARALLEQQ
ncbi:transcriptional regulator [Longimycelium tulufanense]|uniref:Transcriptional regulator n=1 Tax=Longimycelium tulufanense TaxID=907463 RepID=A0A8J3CCC8_9PSEU|nr:sugar-binding domain-containing protein [Longimycelium tulufanense]GGM38804.1 transcriptional regulator [Longimycelium tulufanense]